MTQSKESQARKYMTGIERNYPGFASTLGYCPTNNCSGSGRGSGLCANCYEEKLASSIGGFGDVLAKEFHKAIKKKALCEAAIMDRIHEIESGE